MHHQKHHGSLADRQCICCNSLKRHHGGFEYDSCREQQKEDIDIPGTQECPSMCFYQVISQISPYLHIVPCSPTRSRKPAVPCHTRSQHDRWHIQDYVILQQNSSPSSSSSIFFPFDFLNSYPTNYSFNEIGGGELPHAYLQNETDSCLSDSESDFGEICHQTNVHHVQIDPCFQTCDESEHNSDVSHSQRMNEEPELSEDTLCPCGTVDSRWSSNQWPSVPPPCCNVRNALVVGVEVDVLEEVVYEDTEIIQTQTMFDGCMEDHLMDSTSCYCDQLFFM